MGGAVSSVTSPLLDAPVGTQLRDTGANAQQKPIQQSVFRPPESSLHQKTEEEWRFSAQRPSASQQSQVLPMKLTKHDTATYWGRVQAFRERIRPRFLFVREAEAKKSGDIFALAKDGLWMELRQRGIDEAQLQYHVLIAQSTINSSDGSVIPPLLRLAAFAPVNIPITGGMLLSAPTLVNSIFWQWINQTYNAAFNWANGNKKSEGDACSPSSSRRHSWRHDKEKEDLLKGYAAAVFISVGLAVGMNSMLLRSQLQGALRRTLQAIVPYTAVATANFSNVLLIRGDELRKGIPVFNEDKECLGISRVAAWNAVLQTGVSRVGRAAAFQTLVVCARRTEEVHMQEDISLYAEEAVKVAVELGVIYGCLVGALPLAVGLFPEDSALPLHALEEGLQESIKKQQKSGKAIDTVYFNRGV